jgi:hypothetical protein
MLHGSLNSGCHGIARIDAQARGRLTTAFGENAHCIPLDSRRLAAVNQAHVAPAFREEAPAFVTPGPSH